ncbi:hypothetical protein [Paraburkholderia eburnea]|uniref:hypothetical protein n=1 Tax=Paraburkholderia eburnea TaxID=1189126 RepID=UPI00142D9B14|nr:hypothetical protein [Paraburkholderia eburnea]
MTADAIAFAAAFSAAANSKGDDGAALFVCAPVCPDAALTGRGAASSTGQE